MSLYLSRLCFNPLFAGSLRLVADPYELHRRLLTTVPCLPREKAREACQPKTADVLFRVDATEQGPVVLVQSTVIPNWEALERAPRDMLHDPETKPYDPKFAVGQELGFRLFCKPSIRKSGRFGLKANGKRMAGPRITCRDDTERMEWLRWKGGDSGFTVESVGLTVFSVPSIKSDVPLREPGGSFAAVQFDGTLFVTDPDKLREAVCNGIGTQKAFGFGLLSLAPIR